MGPWLLLVLAFPRLHSSPVLARGRTQPARRGLLQVRPKRQHPRAPWVSASRSCRWFPSRAGPSRSLASFLMFVHIGISYTLCQQVLCRAVHQRYDMHMACHARDCPRTVRDRPSALRQGGCRKGRGGKDEQGNPRERFDRPIAHGAPNRTSPTGQLRGHVVPGLLGVAEAVVRHHDRWAHRARAHAIYSTPAHTTACVAHPHPHPWR